MNLTESNNLGPFNIILEFNYLKKVRILNSHKAQIMTPPGNGVRNLTKSV